MPRSDATLQCHAPMPHSGLVDAETYAAHVADSERGAFAEEEPAHGDLGMKLAYFGSAHADEALGILGPEYRVARSEVAA